MSILGNDLLLGSGDEGYNLTRSLRTRSSASAYLNRTPASAGNQKTWTYSDWIKRGQLGTDQVIFSAGQGAGTLYFYLRFLASNALDVFTYDSNTGTFIWQLTTTQVFRDPSAWYHLIISTDTTQATASNRVKIYVNGTQVTAFSTAVYPTLNYDTRFNANIAHYISSYIAAANFADCYQTELNSVDGQALTPSSFGSTNTLTGVWQPARYTGSYGTNGFYLPFTDNSALTTSSNVGLGKDFSGNGNYWATNNISITAGVTYDSMTDVPTLTSATAANFCTFNPLSAPGLSAPINGNLTVQTTVSESGIYLGTMSSSIAYYFEVTIGAGTGQPSIGVVTPDKTTYNFYCESYVGDVYTGSTLLGNIGACSSGDVLGFAVNGSGSNNYKIYKNGTLSLSATITVKDVTPYVYDVSSSSSVIANLNCGQRPFAFSPPTGYVALNTYNLPTSTIVKGNTVMDATLYTGTGASLSVTNAASFKPDLVWVKGRSGATDHAWYDSVRGTTKQLESNTTGAETTEATGLTAFGSAGFTVGALAQMNTSAATYVGWQWQAGQGTTSSNTNGTITSTVSVNASAGFSVVTFSTSAGYTSGTIGHGLGVAPAMYIVKNRNGSSNINWITYHQSVGNTAALYLNSTSASVTSSTFWNNTSPTSSVFSVAGNLYPSSDMVAYCWTPIAGYSAFGSYTGNGSTDGPFVYTGFRPKYVVVKKTSAADDWVVFDSVRSPYNVVNNWLLPNSSGAELTSAGSPDLLSNGFKMRSTSGATNASGATYIYMAFAENPFRNALAR